VQKLVKATHFGKCLSSLVKVFEDIDNKFEEKARAQLIFLWGEARADLAADNGELKQKPMQAEGRS